MRPYEVMIILDAALEEDALRGQIDKAQEIIRTNGGTPNRVDRWGKRRFAYEVKHQWEGYYVLIEATAEPIAMSELDRALHLADEVIRHKVIRLPEDVAGRQQRTSAPAADSESTPAGASAEATNASAGSSPAPARSEQ
jgi:small subunit ribosomal protein S6